MNRAFRNCRAAILAANENNTAAKIAALQFLVSPKSLGRCPVFSVACSDRLLSSSIEERTKVRSRKRRIRRWDEQTCEEDKSLTLILSLCRKGEANRGGGR